MMMGPCFFSCGKGHLLLPPNRVPGPDGPGATSYCRLAGPNGLRVMLQHEHDGLELFMVRRPPATACFVPGSGGPA